MGWSWRIGRIAGIDVFVHPTFLILVTWVGLSHYLAHGDLSEALAGIGFILALFGIVVLHELGHALTARRFGIRTRDITLLPIGGVARLERIPEVPSQELLVAVAGPMVNVAIAAAIFLLLRILGQGIAPFDQAMRTGGGFLQQMLWVNVSLVVFNMIPAFPMDGGRVLRALLAMRFNYVRATQTAAAVGQAIAIVFGVLGLLANPLSDLHRAIRLAGGAQEAGMVVLRSALAGIPVMRVMITDFRWLEPHDALSTRRRLRPRRVPAGLPRRGRGSTGRHPHPQRPRGRTRAPRPDTPVAEVMQHEFTTADPRDMLQTAFERLQQDQCRTLPVVRDGHLVGLLTADNLAEVLLIQQTLRAADRPGLFARPPVTLESWDRAGRPAREMTIH